MKTIIYINSKQQAMGSITNVMESVIRTSPNQGDVIAMTGDNGIQFVVFTMHAFAHDNVGNNKDDCGTGGGEYSLLPNIRIMPATKAADCGICGICVQWSCCLHNHSIDKSNEGATGVFFSRRL
jgi:hypothetical protein